MIPPEKCEKSPPAGERDQARAQGSAFVLALLVLSVASCSQSLEVGDAGVSTEVGVIPTRFGKFLALGSSSTSGAGATRPERAYVELVAASLRRENDALQVLNLGSGGATVTRFLGEREAIRGFAPDLVSVLPLTDFVSTSTSAFRTGYEELLDLLSESEAAVFFGDLRIDPSLVCGVGSGPGGCYGQEQLALLAGKNAIVAELARERPRMVVVPVFDPNVAHPEYSAPDGHPNDLGHEYLASRFLEAIQVWSDGGR